MGLTEVSDGKKVVITGIEGGRHARKKLMDLGMIPGVPVTIIRKAGRIFDSELSGHAHAPSA